MSKALGIDTSNYTTSAAVFDSNDGAFTNSRQLLVVKNGEIGLRQSDAVFQHTKNLPEIVRAACENQNDFCAVGVSNRPRPLADSYMPCFLSGVAVAEGISAATGKKLYKFSHQAGHIAAALFSSNCLDLIGKKFISFHVSGGTTEAVLVNYDKDNFFRADIIAQSTDLKMGQAVDRIGNMLGIAFPAGKELDKLSLSGCLPMPVKISINGLNCSISGVENQARELINRGCNREDVAYFTIEFLYKTLDKMTENIIKEFGNLPLVFAGGVMSNSIISKRLSEKYGAHFATPQLSSDNAVGIAVMTALLHDNGR